MEKNASTILVEQQSHTVAGIAVAFNLLVKNLEKSGNIPDGMFLEALKKTINDPDAEYERGDYRFLATLARMIEADRALR